MAEPKPVETPQFPPIPTPEQLAKDLNHLQLKKTGIALCKLCGSKKMTDDDNNLICSYGKKDCSFEVSK
jgi:hypothetical protein